MPDPKDITLLIVDDEVMLRRTVAFDFKRRGFQVLEAGSGKEAYDIVKERKVDLILSDVRMPGGDGIELLERVKKLDPRFPIVMLITGFADLSLEDAYEMGAEAVFLKPFDRKSLMESVIRAVTPKDEKWGDRKWERLDCKFSVALTFPDLGTAVDGKVLNLARGGMFVAVATGNLPAVEAKAAYEISFGQGNPSRLHGTGTVRWVRNQHSEQYPRGCGIEFEFLEEKSRTQLLELINTLRTRAYIPKS